MIARRLNRVKSSTSAIQFERVRALQRAGRDIIALNAGEPRFGTPQFIIEAAERAMHNQQTGYTPVAGMPELQEAIADKLQRQNHLPFQPGQIQVTAGSKQAMFNAFFATLEEGDEVIVPTPSWVSYREMVRLVGGEAIPLQTSAESGFVPTAEDLEALITPRTKWLVINSPCNPTGAVYSRENLEALGEVLLRHPHVWVLSDDIYEHLVFSDAEFSSIAEIHPELRERTLVVNGFSKAYCMTGWRLGYAAGPAQLIDAMYVIQSHSTTHASSIAQWAALEALSSDRGFLDENRQILQRNRDTITDAFESIDGFTCVRPEGAFYAFPSCRRLINATTRQNQTLLDDGDVVNYLLEEAGVACMSGASFGMSPYLRISFAEPEDILIEACERIRAACGLLNKSNAH